MTETFGDENVQNVLIQLQLLTSVISPHSCLTSDVVMSTSKSSGTKQYADMKLNSNTRQTTTEERLYIKCSSTMLSNPAALPF